MSTTKNDQISLYCHFRKIIKGPGARFQSPASSQKHVRNIYHTAYYYLTKFHFDRTQDSKEISMCNFHQAVMFMMTSQILKSVDFIKTKIQKSQEQNIFFFQIKKLIYYTSSATILQKIVLQQRYPLRKDFQSKNQIINKFLETTENSKKEVKPNPQPIPQFHFKDDSDDTNKSEKEEIKALEINSTSNDQKDSRQEIDN